MAITALPGLATMKSLVRKALTIPKRDLPIYQSACLAPPESIATSQALGRGQVE